MISIIPIAKEKALTLSTRGQYMFHVPMGASKALIAENVEKQFSVGVVGVRTLVRKGKPTRFSRGKRRYPGTTKRSDVKIAFVTLKEGDKIRVFDEEAVAAPAQSQQKEDDKADKAPEVVTKVKADEKKAKKPLFSLRRTGKRGDK